MPNCIKCGTPTELRVCDQPICPKCADEDERAKKLEHETWRGFVDNEKRSR